MTDFTETRKQFHLPKDSIYLDGNSLGPLPIAASQRVATTLQNEWGEMVVGGWNRAGWMNQPSVLGDRIARLIGAPKGTVIVGDTLSLRVYQALAAALGSQSERTIVLSDSGNFPTDLYMAEGLLRSLDKGHELKIAAPEEVEAAIDEDVAVLMLTEADYRTGRLHDMKKLTAKAHAAGAVVVWDLAHSAGAIPIDLVDANADFAVGCTYKYLNGGPGAPAFIYVREDLLDDVQPALSGWLGHEKPFDFDLEYRPGDGIERMRVGTPPVIQMAALEAALDVWDDVDMNDVREKSIHLSTLFLEGVEAACPQLKLASPRDPHQRGSQVSFRFEHGYSVIQALIARGVTGDFRAPDIMRFGFTPLYLSDDDVLGAVEHLVDIMKSGSWDQPLFHARSAVT